ncbi:threonine/serine dehydratase [Stieleria sp. JC731]|uniref:threonine/serine dehydratase n=1 Tax=Pirellulaceae TaxID=2691357 RepID=UPI001E282FEA|nr:threonine/serine dehydratase [Stieleria sp. JC731]MCC9599295.1 threonine/serine dehydratase [Stieleria sp. JC731]
MPGQPFAIGIDDVRSAHQRIRAHIIRTPCLFHERLSNRLGCQLHFKAENLQHIGAFKARGAINAVLQLNETDAGRGVVTHSSGNHAAALARAASIRGIDAHIVMPHNSSPIKIASVQSYGIEPIFSEPDSQSREAKAFEVQAQTGATLVHPYDCADVMAGQGTVAIEILEQVENLDVILAPVGGGGLLSGILIAAKSIRPEIQVIAVEPAFADDAARSMQSGQREMPSRYDTVADGLRTGLGELTFPIIHRLVDDIVLVKEEEILAATREIAEQVHLVAEPSGAVAYAGLKSDPERFQGKRVAAVISGGNIDFKGCQLGTPLK